MTVKYVGPARDYSGYGEAVRHDVLSLLAAQVNVIGSFPSFVQEIADFGPMAEMIYPLEEKKGNYDITILHLTPNIFHNYAEPGKYHIGRVFWETDKLPQDFVKNCNTCDEIWTGSEFNKIAIRNAGVTRPIYIIPEAIDTSFDVSTLKPYIIPNEKDYKFYSIFEWTNRKNPQALLEAFWTEFENEEGVSLTIKTYVDNFLRSKREEIDLQIRKLKARLNLKRYAPVYQYRQLMDREQIYRFHKTFDCFVSAHRGEGWGIPQMEALLMNNPVISTNCGGIHEYLEDGVSAYLIPYRLINLEENSRNRQWYTPDQRWADVDIPSLRKAMRACFSNKEQAKNMGINGGKLVRERFSPDTVGSLMLKRLVEIQQQFVQNKMHDEQQIA